MKKTYPLYHSNRLNPRSKIVFNSLSNKNKLGIKRFLSIVSVNAKSKKRLDNCERGLIRFFDFIEKDYDKITYEDFIQLSKVISESEYGIHTRNSDRNFIKRFLQENFEDWRTKFKDMKVMKLETQSEEHKLTHKDLVTHKELEKLINSTSDMKYKALIYLLYESGGRPEEILKLKWCDFDFDKGLVYLYSSKTGKKRVVPLDSCIVHLRRLKEETQPSLDSYLFPSYKEGKEQITNAGLNYLINKIRKKSKISKRLNPYTFRHTRLSELIVELSPKVYEDISGHSLSMGMKNYAHLSQDIHIKEMNDKFFKKPEELSEEQEHKLQKEIRILTEKSKKNNEIMEKFNERMNDFEIITPKIKKDYAVAMKEGLKNRK